MVPYLTLGAINKYGIFHNCEAQARVRQARMGKGWPLRQKASKLKPLPRAYIKVPPTASLNKLDQWRDVGLVSQVEVRVRV